MRLKLDIASDALYLRLDDTGVVESEEVQSGVILDYNSQGSVIGVELLGLSKRVPIELSKKPAVRDRLKHTLGPRSGLITLLHMGEYLICHLTNSPGIEWYGSVIIGKEEDLGSRWFR